MEELKIFCDAFIIPNSIMDLDDPFYKDSVDIGIYKKPISIKELNGCTKNRYIQLWLCNESCDNLNDHSFKVNNHKFEYVSSLIPVEIIQGVKEGDCFRFSAIMKEVDSKEDYKINFICIANQREYRYQRFGNFEEVAEKLGV